MEQNYYDYLGEENNKIFIQCPKCRSVQLISKAIYDKLCCKNHNSNINELTCSCGFHSKEISTVKHDNIHLKYENLLNKASLFFRIGIIVSVICFIVIYFFNLLFDSFFIKLLLSSLPTIIGIICKHKLETKAYALLSSEQSAISNFKVHLNSQLDSHKTQKCLDYLSQSGVTENTRTVKSDKYGDCFIWTTLTTLNFHTKINLNQYSVSRDINSIWKLSIPLSDIESFSLQGEIYRENKITGGGSSLSGAIIGGVIAGDTGAVIGSREKVESKLITHDERRVDLNYFENGNRKTLIFDLDALQVFEDLIPEKNATIVSALKTETVLQTELQKTISNSVTEQIRKLAELKDEGILTEEEFSEKKKELLSNIR